MDLDDFLEVNEENSKRKKTHINTPYDYNLDKGVNISWLMKCFHLSREEVKSRLRDCPTCNKDSEHPLYKIHEAAQHLVKPVGDIEEVIKKMKGTQLPVNLQKQYWEAKNEKIDYELKAKHLWRTEDVMTVFADTFKILRDSIFLWVNDLKRVENLSDEQKEFLENKCDNLQDAIYLNLKNYSEANSSSSVFDIGEEDA